MSHAGSIIRTVEVPVDPATAFSAFTDEIDAWFVRGPYSWNDPKRAVGIRFEPYVGGRWLEVWDAATGEGYEMGRVLVWEPGQRLVMTYRSVVLPPEPLTEIEIRFEAIDKGTRVSLEHRGWDRLPSDIRKTWSRRAWIQFIKWFGDYLVARNEEPRRASMTQTTKVPQKTVTPYLCCKDASRALEFYKSVFGAVEVMRWTDTSGRIGHAEFRLGNSMIMLADEHPEIGVLSPQSLGGSPVSLHIYVDNVDVVAEKAVTAGAKLLRPVQDQEYGDRNCKLTDPFGHVWMVATHKEDVTREEMQQRVAGSYEIS